jgi:hypothetical protein
MGGLYDKIIGGSLVKPFKENRFAKKWYEGKQINAHALPNSIIRSDPYARGVMLGHTGPHLWYRHSSS